VICAEIAFGAADFLCVVGFISTVDNYLLTMDTQFEGSGTHQLCFIETNECGLDGVKFPITMATITIARGAALVARTSRMNDLSVSARELHDFKLADAYQFVQSKSISSDEKSLQFQQLISNMRAQLTQSLPRTDYSYWNG